MITRPANISVTLPIDRAINRVKQLLFQPFDPGKWFAIGFCAWLARLGEQGIRANYKVGSSRGRDGGGSLRHQFEQAREYVMSNLIWIVPLFIVVVVVGLALWVLLTWLNSRGKFMFLHCVASNKAEVALPWRRFDREGNSLFWFRLVLGLMGAAMSLPLLALTAAVIFRMVQRGAPSVPGIAAAGACLLAFFAVVMVFWVIRKLTTDFVVPIMFLGGKKCLHGWEEFQGLISTHPGQFVLYLLFQVVLAIAVTIMILIVVLATCCIAGCLLVIPYLGTVLLLPVLAFDRSYSLYYLAQFGQEYDAFASPVPPKPEEIPPSA